jgi:hypothetical protein
LWQWHSFEYGQWSLIGAPASVALPQVLKHGILVPLNRFSFNNERLESQKWLDGNYCLRNDCCCALPNNDATSP